MSHELDVRVATEVMGWTKSSDAHAVNWISTFAPVCWKDCKLWTPSTDMRAAWDIVDEMDRRGWSIMLSRSNSERTGKVCWVAAFVNGKLSRVVTREAAHAPEAICLAALAAMKAGKLQTKGST